jgi:DNA repair protein RadC
MRLKEMCADEMPREKLINKGPEALSNVELLAILLRTGRGGANVIDVAREILLGAEEKLANLALMNIGNLCRTSGVGPGKAVTLAAAFELGRRVSVELATGSKMALSTPQAVYRLMLPVMRDLDHEECWALYLNKSNKLLSKERLTIGGMDSTVIDNRMVLRKALDNKATGLILVHNHPSGSALPSNADLEQTRSLNKALKTCGISLVDHVIIAGNSYYSFADEQF